MTGVKQTKLIQARKDLGLSREKAAIKVQISTSAWVSYERGQRIPSLVVAFKIARFFEVSVDSLFICPE